MLIENWKQSWKFLSMLAAAALGLFDAAYAANFYGLLANLPAETFAAINAAVAGLVIPVLRVLKQFGSEQSGETK